MVKVSQHPFAVVYIIMAMVVLVAYIHSGARMNSMIMLIFKAAQTRFYSFTMCKNISCE